MQNDNTACWAVRVVDLLIRAAAWVATAALILIMTGICLEVIARYIFSSSIHGMHSIVEGLLLPTVIFLGAPLVGRMDGHMKVEIFNLNGWPRWRAVRRISFAVLISAFWLACGWQAALRAHEAYVLKQWPIGEIAAPILFCFGITALGCLLAACAHLVPLADKEAKAAQPDIDH